MEEPTSPRGPHNLTFGSLFAGVGGFDLGFEAAGWEPRWQVEWDARCRSVLERHWPQVTRYGDVRDVRDPEPVDLVTYGFPCQDLSVAGRRAGLDGTRSGLFFEATRIIKEMRDASGGRYPTWAVAENVPGLLSADGGAAMGRCLDTLADIGAVGIEWAVLDAQHFGVPQRRRRVFLVAWWDPRISGGGPLLPVSESCSGHPQPGPTAGPSTSRHVAECLNSGGNTEGFRTEPGAHLIPAFVKARRAQSEDDYETWETGRPAPTLNAFDNGSESRATVLAFAANQRDEVRELRVAGALAAQPGMKQQTFLAMQVDGSTVASTLRGFGHGWQGQHNSTNSVATQMGVRRLTPRECERLMGWPDDHTRWAADGTEIADTNRYKMCGNGVVAPVAEWVANRLLDAHPTAG